MENPETRIRELYDSGYFCAEAVLITIAEYKGIKSDLIPKISTGLCAGFAGTSGMCGALSGSILAVNMILGRSLGSDSKDKNYTAVQQLISLFEDRASSSNCTALMGCHLGTEEGRITFYDENLIEKCKEYCVIAVDIATSLLQNIADEANRP